MTGNIQRLKKINELYDPKTAFGNKEVIELMNQMVRPDETGAYETEGQLEDVHLVNLYYTCPNCGRMLKEEVEVGEYDSGDVLSIHCDNSVCRAKLKINIE